MAQTNVGMLSPEVRRALAALATLAGVVICTSTTRPTAPQVGQSIFETDTSRVYIWNGSTWVAPVAVWA
jgi:hypothetical protein